MTSWRCTACLRCRDIARNASGSLRESNTLPRGVPYALAHGTINLSLEGLRPPDGRNHATGLADKTREPPWLPTPGWCRRASTWCETELPGLHHAPDLTSLLAHRPVPASQSRPHGLPEQPPGRRPQAGGQETPAAPSSGRSKSSTSPAGSARSPPATGPRPVPSWSCWT